MNYYQAGKNFEDNLKNWIDAHQDPVAYNLNMGLLTLVQALQSTDRRVRSLEDRLDRIEAQLRMR